MNDLEKAGASAFGRLGGKAKSAAKAKAARENAKKPRPRWRPMETAPKDREILAFGRIGSGTSIAIVEWLKGSEMWEVVHDTQGYAWAGFEPTHWMPLPPNPVNKPSTPGASFENPNKTP